jgi:Ca2+-binding RTX toxin-like protein
MAALVLAGLAGFLLLGAERAGATSSLTLSASGELLVAFDDDPDKVSLAYEAATDSYWLVNPTDTFLVNGACQVVLGTAVQCPGALVTEIAVALGGGDDTLTVLDGIGVALKVAAGDGGDTIHGSSSPEAISGGEGLDVIYGGGGNDELSGGDETDDVHGGPGDDTLGGGTVYDALNGDEAVVREVWS